MVLVLAALKFSYGGSVIDLVITLVWFCLDIM